MCWWASGKTREVGRIDGVTLSFQPLDHGLPHEILGGALDLFCEHSIGWRPLRHEWSPLD